MQAVAVPVAVPASACRTVACSRRAVAGNHAFQRLQPEGRGRPTTRRRVSRHQVIRAWHGHHDGVNTVSVTFKIKHKVKYGQHMRVVGNTDQLGHWEMGSGAEMRWSEGDVWSATVQLPAGFNLEYKFVRYCPKGRNEWESGKNRCLTVDAAVPEIAAIWNKPLATTTTTNGQEAAQQAQQEVNGADTTNTTAVAVAAGEGGEGAMSAADLAQQLAAQVNGGAAPGGPGANAIAGGPTINGAPVVGYPLPASAVGAAYVPPIPPQGWLDDDGTPPVHGSSALSSYTAAQLEFLKRKLDAIQARPAAVRPGSSPSPSPGPAANGFPADPAAAALNWNDSVQPGTADQGQVDVDELAAEQRAFMQRRGSVSPRPRAASAEPAPRAARSSTSPGPSPRALEEAGFTPEQQRELLQRRASASPIRRAASASPAPTGSTLPSQPYTPEQLAFLQRKASASPARAQEPSPRRASPARRATPPRHQATPGAAAAASPAPAAAAESKFSPEQLAFLKRKSTSPSAPASPQRPAASPTRRSSSRPVAGASRSPAPTTTTSAAAAPNGNYSPEQLAFLQRKNSPKAVASTPSNGAAPKAAARSYSPEQVAFLKRAGKL